MDSVYILLSKIREHPQMYLGKVSLELLYAFIDGYKCHEIETNAIYSDCLDGFTEFVAKKYDMSTTHNWSDYIRFFNIADEDAFRAFFELFDEYMAKKQKSGNRNKKKQKIEISSGGQDSSQ